MCQFGTSFHIISELNLTQEDSIRGFRDWYLINSFNNKEKFLKSLNQNYNWPKNKIIRTDLDKYDSLGYYNYNHNYNYNYNNDYYNYNYNYKYDSLGYYNYNHNYNICGTTRIYGKIFIYKEGFRSEYAIPEFLVIINNEKLIKKIPKFTEHFNNTVINIAKEYNCKTINWSEYVELPKTTI